MIKVLIAEDEEGILYSISNAFSWENMGCEIIGLAQNGIQALEYSLSTPPDIVISDIVMPGIDGITFLRYLKEKYPNTQFIILTGHRNFEYACDALNLGAAVFLLKPVNYKELENHLKKIINTILASQEQQQIENQQDYILSNLLSGHVYSSIDFSPRILQLLDSLKQFRVCAFQFDDNQEHDIFRIHNLAKFCESINSIIGSDKQQTALLFEKYANFQKVIRCDTLEMLKDIFVNMIIDLSDFRSIKTSTKQDIVNKITDYISNHYMEQLSLSTVAKSVFLSPSYLSSLITGETGKNFTDIVNEIRISKSIELLKNPKMRIADIAYSVGFNEPQYFSSIFKKCTNLTPRDYRDFYLSSVTERK